MASVRENIAAGKYANNEPYTVPKNPVTDDMTVGQARDHEESERQRVRDHRRNWRIKSAALVAVFRADLEAENGTVGNPKSEKLWSLAWEHGHGCDYSEVIHYYEEFAELVTL